MKHGKSLILLLLSLFIVMPSRAATVNIDSVLSALDHVVERRDTYYVAHLWKIDSVKKELANVPEADYRLRAQILHEIFNRYKSFQGDSAIAVADREIELAAHIDDPDVRVRARADKLFSQISTANFTDAVDLVRSTDLRGVSPRMKGEFYFLCRRLFSDMSNFTDGTFSDNGTGQFQALYNSLLFGNSWQKPDYYFVLYELLPYIDRKLQALYDTKDPMTFGRKCLMNTCAAGPFSSDRTIRQYAEEIWHIEPLTVEGSLPFGTASTH
jgi:hypothetical protein